MCIRDSYYTPEVHQAAFALPRFIRDLVDDAVAGDLIPRPTGRPPR